LEEIGTIKNEHHSPKEAEIYAAAARLFCEKGFHATTMSEIARSVGIQKASLYHYVSGKDDLLLRTSQQGILTLNRAVAEIVESDLPADEKLRRAFTAHIRVLCQNMDTMTVFLRERRALPTARRGAVLEEGKRYEQMIQQILRDGITSGRFRPVDVTMTSYAMLGAVNWLYQWFRADGRLSPEEIAGIFVGFFSRGLMP